MNGSSFFLGNNNNIDDDKNNTENNTENESEENNTPKKDITIPKGLIFGIIAAALVLMVIITSISYKKKDNTNEGNDYESRGISISFRKDNYYCKEGDIIETKVNIINEKNKDFSLVLDSSNEDIALVDEKEESQSNCEDCRRVIIKCKKVGESTLTAELGRGINATASLIVTEKGVEIVQEKEDEEEKVLEFGKIIFDQEKYSCLEGDTIETRITAGMNFTTIDTVKSYSSSNEKVVSIDEKTQNKSTDLNRKTIRIVCNKKGTATLNTVSENGAKGSAQVTVSSKDVGVIAFLEQSYSCKVGEVIKTSITTKGAVNPKAKMTYSSSDKNTAKIESDTTSSSCIGCIPVKITCLKEGNVTLNVTAETGAKTSTKVQINTAEVGSISFEKSSYTCKTGNTINTVLRATKLNVNTTKVSYASSNSNIASIEKDISSAVCADCFAIKIGCKKDGTVTLSAITDKGATASSKVTVSTTIETINFAQESYTCTEGESITTTVSSSYGSNVSISYLTDNSTLATITKTGNGTSTCPKCQTIRIDCKKPGTATLSAQYNGTKGTAKVTINKNKGAISFANNVYTCKAGASVKTTLKLTKPVTTSSKITFSSSNTSTATIEKDSGTTPSCSDCVAVKITCKKEGSVTLNAEADTGATASSTLTISGVVEQVSFKDSKYECYKGKSISVKVNTTSGPSANITYTSSDKSIATVEKNTSSCSGCQNITINCVGTGKATLTATSIDDITSSTTVEVTKDPGIINYEKKEYYCYPGMSLETTIFASVPEGETAVGKYSSDDTTIATVDDKVVSVIKGEDSKKVRISCISSGDTNVHAVSTTGAEALSQVHVVKDTPTITFAERSYSCTRGKTIDTTVSASSLPDGSHTITKVDLKSRMDTFYASVSVDGSYGETTRIKINCLRAKKGTISIVATSSAGATETVGVTYPQ